MRVSISLTDYTWPDSPAGIAANLRDVVRAADAAGVDTVWVADHLLQADPNSQPGAEMLEAYTVLGYLAGVSERVRLGTLVSAATYRAPAMLIKAVTTVDVLSHGRAWLGIGAGYLEDEAAAYELSASADRGALSDPGGHGSSRTADVVRRRQRIRGCAAPPRATGGQPAPAGGAAPAVADRRDGRALDAAAGRALRRRVQSLRHSRRWKDHSSQTRRAGWTLQRSRSSVCLDREDGEQPLARGRAT